MRTLTTRDLTDEERRALLRLVRDALAETRFPMSPEAKLLRSLLYKLDEDERQSSRR